MEDLTLGSRFGNMRDHLLSIAQIQRALADQAYDQAAQIAESRLGMTSMAAHHAAQMAPYMPQGMQAAGTAMHHAASQLAIAIQDGAAKGDTHGMIAAVATVTETCATCHAAFRVR